ncbi:DUF5642 family protein [Nocardia sp. CC227C]|uniref:DUF5642 family protein n=1 Tax=Nocardia sp. CC227C TaxID=3044562 RepID=UPI00278C2A68|nr:DUF5642 family protein [Nocardia sp. CC227C]
MRRRTSTGRRLSTLLGVLLGVVALGCALAACGTTISGHPRSSSGPNSTAAVSELARLLPNPSQFPAPYAAVELPPDTAEQAAHDLDGILPGARVDPEDCVPVPPVSEPAVSVGTDDATRATLTVELVRTDHTLGTLRQQLERCGTVRATQSGTSATVTTELLPPPPLDADETVALRRTVRSEAGDPGTTRIMRTLLGQVGDVRINVTYMTFGDDSLDGEALDSLFTTAVSKVRRG